MKKCIICSQPHYNKLCCSLYCRGQYSSRFNKKNGIKPPSRKGIKWTKEAIKKRTLSRQKNGWNKNPKQATINKKQALRKHYDKIGRKGTLLNRVKACREYKEWRKEILQRDNYKCIQCGAIENLHIDHIVPKIAIFVECKFDFDLIMQHKKIFDLKNGRTLCQSCHFKTPTHGINRSKFK